MRKREEKKPGKRSEMTRRDFIGGSLIGSGVVLLSARAPGLFAQGEASQAAFQLRLGNTMPIALTGLDEAWSGPGGVGDYAVANGDTWREVNAGHAFVRNGGMKAADLQVTQTGEHYDLVVVGSGFAGCAAAYTFLQNKPDARILILENHLMFGGEARQNEFEVDGYTLWGPQGSTGVVWPLEESAKIGVAHEIWDELKLPRSFEWQEVSNSSVKVPMDTYSPMHLTWESSDLGWFFNGHDMARNPWSNRFANVPLDDQTKHDLLWMEVYRQPPEREDWDRWLDSMTYKEFLKSEMGIDNPWVDAYLNPFAAAMGCGLGTDVISAYQAYNFLQPGVMQYGRQFGLGDLSDKLWIACFPGGNTGVLRHIVLNLIPGIFGDTQGINDVLSNPVEQTLLDREGSPVRMRLGSLAVQVEHLGDPSEASEVGVTYLRDGELRLVTASHVVMGAQQHVNKRVVADLPVDHKKAMDQFMHAPIMIVNVAIRNWKFMDELGIASIRWFDDDFGWFTSLRRQMILDGEEPMPLDPDKPTVLTFYNSFCIPGLPIEQQTVAARMRMFSMSFAEVENRIRDQFTKMFAAAGFDADRDIAGITVNRQGHAYVVTPPGFFFGKDGEPSSSDVIRKKHGRIAFAHSELMGVQMWEGAVREGQRAARQLLAIEA